MTAEEKRALRLARNREAARLSRKKKKQQMELHEEKVAQLTKQLDELRRAKFETAENDLNARRLAEIEELNKLASKSNRTRKENHALEVGVAQLQERFGPHSQERRIIRDFHFKRLDRLLAPLHVRFLLWMAGQPATFWGGTADNSTSLKRHKGVTGESGAAPDAPSSAPNKLWQLVCSELNMTAEQAERFSKDLHTLVDTTHREQVARLKTAAALLVKFRAELNERAQQVEEQSRALFACLTPEQTIRYMIWLQRNRMRINLALDPAAAAAAASSGGGAGAGAGLGRM